MAVPKGKYFLVVEDDPDQSEAVKAALRRRFPDHDVLVVETESEFRQQFQEISKHPPAVAIIDVILPWCDPDDIPERPQEVAEGGVEKAGLRCEYLLREDSGSAQVPVIFHTVKNENALTEDLESARAQRSELGLPEFEFLGKEPMLDALLETVKKRMGHSVVQ